MWLSIPLKSAPAWACLARDYAPGSPEWALPLASGATLNGKHTQPQSWQRACKTARWMRHLSGPTFSPSTLAPGLEQWIASLRASRARTCPLRGDGPGLMANEAASSSTSSILPTLAVRDTSFWRTSQASLLPPPPLWTKPKGLSTNAQPPASWENWPTAGGTRNGSLFQRPTWAPATGGRGGFAGHGGQWMTPNVPNGGRHVPQELVNSNGMTEDGQKRTVGLESQSKYWTTPTAHDATERGSGQKPTAAAGNACLARDARTWATPRANDAEKRGNVTHRPSIPDLVAQAQAWPTPRGSDGTKGGPNQAGSKGDLMLPSAAAQWPTPAARDSKGPNSEQHALETGGGAGSTWTN